MAPTIAEETPFSATAVPVTSTVVVLCAVPDAAVIVTVRLDLSELVLKVTVAEPEVSVVAELAESVPEVAANVTVWPDKPPLLESLTTAVTVTVLDPLVVRLGDETERVTFDAEVPPDEDEDDELEDELELHVVAKQDVPPPPPPPHATKVAHAAAAASTFKYCNISTPAIQCNEQTKPQLLTAHGARGTNRSTARQQHERAIGSSHKNSPFFFIRQVEHPRRTECLDTDRGVFPAVPSSNTTEIKPFQSLRVGA